jgi:hypothetical protein
MPRLVAKPRKPKPNVIYGAWQSFTTDIPEVGTVVQRGARLRGDSEIVKAHSRNFVEDGVPESEWPSPFDQLAPPTPEQPRFYRPAPPIPDDQVVEAIEGFSVGLSNLRATTVAKGQRLHRDDPLVKAHPEFSQIPARTVRRLHPEAWAGEAAAVSGSPT